MNYELIAIKALLLALGMQALSLALVERGRWVQVLALAFLSIGVVNGFVVNGLIRQYFSRGMSAFLDIGLVYTVALVATVIAFKRRPATHRKRPPRTGERGTGERGQVMGLGVEAKPTGPSKGKASDDQIENK